MAALRVSLPAVLTIMTVMSWSQSLPTQQDSLLKTIEDDQVLTRNKRAVGPMNILGLIVSVASTLQGGICTFSSICGPDDPLPAKLDALQEKLDEIGDRLSSLQSDVSDIWQETKQSWFIDHILYVRHLRQEVLKIPLQVGRDNGYRRLKLQRFIDEVLGENGNDKNVLEALYQIPRLVRQERLIEQYLETQKRNKDNTREAIKETWAFIKKIFDVQNDGYVSVLIAYALKYRTEHGSKRRLRKQIAQCTRNENQYKRFIKKYTGKEACLKFDKVLEKCTNHLTGKPACEEHKRLMDDLNEDDQAFRHAVSEICQLWNSSNTNYQSNCSALRIEQNYLKDRRKPQQDHIFTIIELFQYPALQVERNCSEGGRIDGLVFWRGNPKKIWGYKTDEGNVIYLDYDDNITLHTFEIQGNPIDVHVGGQSNNEFRVAVATQSRWRLLYRFGQTPGILLESVCTNLVLNSRDGDIISVVVCGAFFGYMTDRGLIELFNIDDCDSRPVKTWKLFHRSDKYHHLRCSNDGTKLLVAASLDSGNDPNYSNGYYFWGFAAINLDPVRAYDRDLSITDKVNPQAEILVLYKNLSHWYRLDNTFRLGDISGMALDHKGNYFVSSSAVSSFVAGIYQRTSNNTLRIIREYPRDTVATLSDLAVDVDGFVHVQQRVHWGDQCIHKYNPNVDFENVKLTWSDED